MKKETLPFQRIIWCPQCQKMTKHLIYYVGRDRTNLNNILYYKFCCDFVNMQYESQKLLHEEKTGTEFLESDFKLSTIVLTMRENDWEHLLKNDY